MHFSRNNTLGWAIKNAKRLAFCSLVFCAGQMYAQQQGIRLPQKAMTLQEIFKEIEEQTRMSVDYNNSKVTDAVRKTKVNVDGGNVREVLEDALKGTGLSYRIEGNHVVIFPQEKPADGKRRQISGVVLDDKGDPVIGGTVRQRGTDNGTITDMDGRFTLTVPDGAVLTVSYVGYESRDVVADASDLKIKLHEDTKVLDEVVVIGYGTTSAKKMVSAVTAVKGEKVQGLTDASVMQSLQGRASGVIVQNSGGEPGSKPSISIRGGGDPIYVIDGVISTDGWEFETLNPNDIESISILKDAASLAVYGSRAADGIILVKTKEGRKGKRSITYSFNAQYSQPTVLPEKMDSYEFATLQNAAAQYDGLGEFSQFTQEELDVIRNQTDPYNYPNTDWYKLGLKNFAPEYRHSLSITGNQKDVNYYLSMGIFDQGSLYTSNALNYTRYNLRSNVNTTFEEIGLKVSMNINAAYEKKKYPSYSAGNIWGHLQSKSPLDLAYNEDGTLSTISDNPLMEMDGRSGYDKNDGMFLNAQFAADWAVPGVKGLNIGAMFNYRLNSSHLKTLSARAPQYNKDGTLLEVTKPSLSEQAYFGNAYNFELSAGYMRTFADVHSIDAKFVFTTAENDGYNFSASRREYLSATVDQLFAGASTTMENTGNADEGGRIGLVGRLKYDYANRYYIEGSFRYDGSDNFAPGHRWGFFPSVALAWDITEEPFFQNLGLDDVNLLKLRGSYGKMGTESGVNRFGYLSTYSMVENAIVLGGELQSGFNEGNLVNPSALTWYTRTSLDYGLDMAFFRHRLKASVDYFYYVTKGGLMSPADRYITPLGTSLPQIKSDTEHRREGFEVSASWSDELPSGFKYSVGTNMTYYNNLYVKNQGEAQSTTMNPYKRGTHQTDYYGLVYLDNGLFQTSDQILNSPRPLSSTETKMGDVSYIDVNGDGKIDGEDQVRYGMPASPHFTYGIDFMFSYKGFTLSGLFYGTGKRNMEFDSETKKGESIHAVYKYQLDYWSESNRDATFPRMSQNALPNGSNNAQTSTFWIRNAAFFRLKNLSLSYDFKYKLLKNVDWLSMCRVSLTGANLFTISDVMDYWDPEGSAGGSYPVQRVYSLGVTVGF